MHMKERFLGWNLLVCFRGKKAAPSTCPPCTCLGTGEPVSCFHACTCCDSCSYYMVLTLLWSRLALVNAVPWFPLEISLKESILFQNTSLETRREWGGTLDIAYHCIYTSLEDGRSKLRLGMFLPLPQSLGSKRAVVHCCPIDASLGCGGWTHKEEDDCTTTAQWLHRPPL